MSDDLSNSPAPTAVTAVAENYKELLELAYQYMDDMRYPPNEESRERRIARIAEVIQRATK